MKKMYFIIAIVWRDNLSAYGCSSTTTIIEEHTTTTDTQIVTPTTSHFIFYHYRPGITIKFTGRYSQVFVASGTYSDGRSGVDNLQW